MVSDWVMRLRSLVRKRTIDRDLDDEMAFHLEQHVAASLARGVSQSEALRLARIEFGGVQQIKEEHRDARGISFVTDLGRDVRYALNTFRQLPAFAVMALLILALGIAATTVMFAVINGVLVRPLPYPDSQRLVSVRASTERFGELWGFSYPDFLDLQQESRSLSVAAWRYAGGTIEAPGEAAYVDAREISAELFSVLGVSLERGRAFHSEEDRRGATPVAVISYSLWQRRFGGATAVAGRALTFEGKQYTIAGVAPAGFALNGEADVFTPLGQNTDVRMRNRDARFLHVVARVNGSATLVESNAEVGLIGRRLAARFSATNTGRDLLIRPLRDEVVGDVGPTLWLLLAAVGALLAIACVNIASLMLARAVSRQTELATRVALGAGRNRVVRQCLTESAVLGVAGGAFGVILAMAAVRPFVALWPGILPRASEIQIDWRVLLAAFGVSVLCSVVFGLVPALRVPVVHVDQALRAEGRTIARTSRRLHAAFVMIELTLAVVLLVSAGMLGRALFELSSRDSGLNAGHVVTARVALSPSVLNTAGQIQPAWTDVLERARHVPGVQSVALTDIVPMRQGENTLPYSTSATIPPSNQAPTALASSVTSDYLHVMGIPLRAGRFFDEHDGLGGEPVVVIDENLAQHAFGTTDVVGRQLWVAAMGLAPIRIVGVVGHVRHWGLAADDQARVRDQMYYPFAQVPDRLLRLFSSLMSIAVRTSAASFDVVEPLQSELRGSVAGAALYQVRTMEQLTKNSLARQRFVALVFAIFAGIALVLASVGVYGVLAYLTNRRATELRVRMALGATAADVIRLVLRQSAAPIALSVVIGTGGAWAAARLLQHFVEGLPPADPATFVVMTSVLVVTALLASLVPARRAGQLDAAQSLRRD